ncbi:MAG: FAD-binding protein [bacterium]|nr:FAD-binding protein [bacterium]
MATQKTYTFDAVIVGAGGRVNGRFYMPAEKCQRRQLSKLYPTRSYTGAAQGGVGAALGNMEEDWLWEWYAFDTVKGSDYLADQDAVDILCQDTLDVVIENGAYGAAVRSVSKRPYSNAALEASPTTKRKSPSPEPVTPPTAPPRPYDLGDPLHNNASKTKSNFDEYHVVDLIRVDDTVRGVVAY